MLNSFKGILIALTLMFAVGMGLAELGYYRGYHRADDQHRAQIAEIHAENLARIRQAREELEVENDALQLKIQSTEGQLKEIINGEIFDFTGGCGIPDDAIRLLDEIR